MFEEPDLIHRAARQASFSSGPERRSAVLVEFRCNLSPARVG
jgi:hypothetical protein